MKCDLFEAFCCNTYCSHLSCDLKNETLRRLIVGYNHSFRIIMKYPRYCSASGMFVFNNVPSFKELWRESIYGFKQRVDNSLNKVVNTVANTSPLSSRLTKNTGEQYVIVYRWHSPDAHVPEIKHYCYYYYLYILYNYMVCMCVRVCVYVRARPCVLQCVIVRL